MHSFCIDPGTMHFFPNFCPYLDCPQHDDTAARPNFWRHGKSKTGDPRFRCKSCHRTFGRSQFKLEFRNRRLGLNSHIFQLCIGGFSNRHIAASLSCSPTLVRLRIDKMAIQALCYQSKNTRTLLINEPISFDGLENFARSQYEPNNINHAIGRNSLFIYDFNLVPMNRKGRMSDRQKIFDDKFQKINGTIPDDAIQKSVTRVFRRLVQRKPKHQKKITLYSDRHFAYRQAISENPILKNAIDHVTVSSKDPRTYKNILFPVNHTDSLSRHQIKAFTRETISFSKTHVAMAYKYSLLMIWKNYMRPQFTKPHKRDPDTNKLSPAQRLGLTKKVLSFGDIFRKRLFIRHSRLNKDWLSFAKKQCPRKLAIKQGKN